jgi:hypothetical protein
LDSRAGFKLNGVTTHDGSMSVGTPMMDMINNQNKIINVLASYLAKCLKTPACLSVFITQHTKSTFKTAVNEELDAYLRLCVAWGARVQER